MIKSKKHKKPTMYSLLEKHFKETPKDEIIKEWEEIEKMKLGGPTVEKFLKDLDKADKIKNKNKKL